MSYPLNENIPLEAVEELQEDFDIIWVRDWKLRAKDPEILEFSAKIHQIVLTFDNHPEPLYI